MSILPLGKSTNIGGRYYFKENRLTNQCYPMAKAEGSLTLNVMRGDPTDHTDRHIHRHKIKEHAYTLPCNLLCLS